jgi:hypothetical protein
LLRGYFTDRNHIPSPAEIHAVLGSCHILWQRLTHFIERADQVERRWSMWGPKQSGWKMRYTRKGRAIAALYPLENRLIVEIVLGKVQAERAMQLDLGDELNSLVRETPQLRDGRWL